MLPVFRRSAIVAAALLASAVLSVARAAEPDVLSKVPGDAYGLIVVNNVRNFANKLSNAGTRLNAPMPPDLVGWATKNLGITEGFEANASAAVVLLKPSPERQAEGYFSSTPPAVILLPTSDAKTMLKPFDPKEPDKAGISEVTLPQDPSEKGFVVTVDDKWVAFAQSKEDLASYLARTGSFADKASAPTKKVFEDNDLVVWGNVTKLSTGVDKALDDAQTEVAGMLDLANMANNQDAVSSAMQKQSIGMIFGFTKEFLKDADASMLTLRLTDSGATFGLVGDFKSDTPIGRWVAAQKSAKPVTLQGLPAPAGDAGFLAAGAANWDPASMVKVMTSVSDALLSDETIAKDPRVADLKKAFETQKQLMAITTGASFVALEPVPGGKEGYFNGVILMNTSDPAKFKKLQVEALKASMAQQSMNPDYKQKVTVTNDAVTIKGVKLTKINVKISLREETPDKPINPINKKGFEMVQKFYGPNGITAYTGTVGKRAVLIYGSEPTTLESAISAAQENTDELSNNQAISSTKEQVLANPVAVAYLPITRWALLAESVVKSMNGAAPAENAPAPSPAITGAPPIVMSAGVNGNMVTAELHVPIATISGMQEAITRLTQAAHEGATPAAPQTP